MEVLCALSAAWEKEVSSELPYWARGASHSLPALLSPQERVLLESLHTVTLVLGWHWQFLFPSVPLKLVFLLVFFFSHMVFWNLPLGRLDFHNYSLVCGYLPSAALSRFSRPQPTGLGQVAGSAAHTKVCLYVPKCTSGQDSFQAVCHLLLLDPTSSIETLL